MSMETHNGLILSGVSLQRLLIEAMRDEDAKYTYDPAGKSLSFSHGGYGLTFNGSGLVGVDGNFSGVTTDFVIEGKGGSISGLFIVAPEYDDLYQAAEAGSGDINPINFSDFYDLYVPPGNFYIVNGDGRDNTAEGSNGDDFANLLGGADTWIAGPGNDEVDAGKGTDTMDASELSAGITYNMAKETLAFDVYTSAYSGFEDAHGTAFNDRFTGNGRANWLFGEAGNDIIKGQGGDDWLNGSKGRDKFFDGTGSDWLVGGPGGDQFFFGLDSGMGNVINDMETGKDTIDVAKFGYETFDQAKSHFTQVGLDTMFSDGDVDFTIKSYDFSSLVDDIRF